MIGVKFAWFDSDESSMKQQRGKGQLVFSFPSSFLLLLTIKIIIKKSARMNLNRHETSSGIPLLPFFCLWSDASATQDNQLSLYYSLSNLSKIHSFSLLFLAFRVLHPLCTMAFSHKSSTPNDSCIFRRV
jgi:hypothetical protein